MLSFALLARIPVQCVLESSHARCSRCMACLAPVGSMWCCRVLFGPGPKPRQARDGHSWRMVIQREWRPLFSFCQRAPRLSSPIPLQGGVWKSGVRLSGTSTDPRTLLAVVRGVPVDVLGALAPTPFTASRPSSPVPGEGGRPAAVHTLPEWCVHAPCFV